VYEDGSRVNVSGTYALETGSAFGGFLSGEVAEAVIFGFCVVALAMVEGCFGVDGS
jgi:hypothetical protein